MQKIVFVIESLQCGGAEKSLITLLQNFNFKKFNVDLILFNKGGEFEKFIPREVNVIYKDYYKNINVINRLIKRVQFWFIKKTPKSKNHHGAQLYWKIFGPAIKILNKSYDMAIAYNQGFSTYYVANKIIAPKKFAWLNTDYKNAGYNINFDFKHYNCFNKIVCVSEACETSLLNEALSIKKTLKTTIIKDISDQALINKMSLENDGLCEDKSTIKLLSIGRLAKAKAFHLAIEACKILVDRGRNVKWHIIGEGPERQDLKRLIEENKLESYLILLGYKENPYPYIKSCDIYVQTSLFEGLGLTVIEACILCKPIVTTNFPTAFSIIEDKVTGLICNMNSMAIATAIEAYLDDDTLLRQIIDNLSKLKNTDKENSLKKIEILFNKN